MFLKIDSGKESKMGFDLSNVINQANSVVSEKDGGYKYSLLYPSVGTLDVKLLFNPASNSVTRLVPRHYIDENRVPCLKAYNMNCPICSVLEEIKNATGTDLFRMKAKFRGISFAQFIKASYDEDRAKEGDIVLLMYPWTVYKSIQNIFSSTPSDNIEEIISKNEGYPIVITHSPDHSYDARISPFSKYKSCDSDADFDNLLNRLDSLNEQIIPSSPTDDVIKQVQSISTDLRNTHLQVAPPKFMPTANQVSSSVANFTSNTVTQPTLITDEGKGDDIPFDPNSTMKKDGRPECFGRYGDDVIDYNSTCVLCPVEFDCKETTGK